MGLRKLRVTNEFLHGFLVYSNLQERKFDNWFPKDVRITGVGNDPDTFDTVLFLESDAWESRADLGLFIDSYRNDEDVVTFFLKEENR